MATFALLHSPLVGPFSWSAVARELGSRGHDTLTPDLDGREDASAALWAQHAHNASVAIASLPASIAPILVAHSGAGALLPAIRDGSARRVAGYLFVDAGLPSNEPRKGTGEFARYVDALHADGRRFPDWTDDELRDAIPDAALRQLVLADLRPQPPRFWAESPPVGTDWPDAPCGYLCFTYDAVAAEARRRGWPCHELTGEHFHLLVDPAAVSDEILSLAREIGAL